MMEDWFVPRWGTKDLSVYYYSTFESVKLIEEILIKQSKKESSYLVKCASTPLFTSHFIPLSCCQNEYTIRCFASVISPNYCKYTFYCIAIFKSECRCLHANSCFSGLTELFSVAAALNLSILPKMHRRFSKRYFSLQLMCSYHAGVFYLLF